MSLKAGIGKVVEFTWATCGIAFEALLIAGLLFGTAVILSAQDVTFHEYQLAGYPVPTSITSGSDGALWFTEYFGNKIGRITTNGVITEYPVPMVGSDLAQLGSITAGPDGALWFVENYAGKVGRISTAGVLTEYAVPSGNRPGGMTVGPDGALWFTGGGIGRITTAGVITEYPLPSGSGPTDITLGPDGALWFIDITNNQIGRMTGDGVLTAEYPLSPISCLCAVPAGIAAGPDGGLWFAKDIDKVGRISTSGEVTVYPVPHFWPGHLTVGPDGAPWFTEYVSQSNAFRGYIGRITADGVIKEYPIPTDYPYPGGLTLGPDGALWFTEQNTGKIGQAAFARSYTVTDLGILSDGGYSAGYGINQSGEVTGVTTTGAGATHAFLYSNGTMQDLGTLPGGRNSLGAGINASGQVTGWSDTSTVGVAHAFLYGNGTMQDLGPFFGRAINASGQVTGNAKHAFLFSNGTMYDLGTLPGFTFSSGYGINDSGQVTGEVCCPNHGFLYSNGIMQYLPSGGRAINASGQVTGSSPTGDGHYHAFLYSNGTTQDLGTLPGGTFSSGLAINDLGEVTGQADAPGAGGAYLYSNGIMQDLNKLIPLNSGWTLEVGNGINNAGQITGSGTFQGRTHAFLLTRCPPTGCPVVPDTAPPWITLSATPTKIWPANDKEVPVTVWGTITDVGSGLVASKIQYFVTDEYRQVQLRGHLILDAAGNYAFQVLLPASLEAGDRDGRRYTIRVSARDNAGHRGDRWIAVRVLYRP